MRKKYEAVLTSDAGQYRDSLDVCPNQCVCKLDSQ